MTITSAQKAAIEEVLDVIVAQKDKKRLLSELFLELVDPDIWAHYYEVIPAPRSINNIRKSLEKNRYKEPLAVYNDLALVFWNALYYNEDGSQIASDAAMLKHTLETEWKKRAVLPPPARTSPPPESAQKKHAGEQQPTTTDTQQHSQGGDIDSQSEFSDIDILADPLAEGEADPRGPEIAKRLDDTLQRWPGFGEQGWATDIKTSQFLDIVHALKNHKDSSGNRWAAALETLPEQSKNYTSNPSVSLKMIESRARHSQYPTAKSFDMDMSRLFERGRRYHDPLTEPYGRVLLLQRLYQAITSSKPPEGPPYPSKTGFASLQAGPGNVKPLRDPEKDMDTDHLGLPGITSHTVPQVHTSIDEVHYKGWSIKPGDWLHLSNPDDPTRPIIAQVFRCWVSDAQPKKKSCGVGVCWYYRPEQTFHPVDRNFWQGEIFKTSHFVDHPVEDIIEKVACQFPARHIRGRPRPPHWYPGWPLYVCDSIYSDQDRTFEKITDWKATVPEQLRASTSFMAIFPFEKVVLPNRLQSPFLSNTGKKLPGGLLGVPGVAVKKEPDPPKVASKAAAPGAGLVSKPPAITYTTITTPSSSSTHPVRPVSTVDRSVATAIQTSAPGAQYRTEKLPPETAQYFDRDPNTNEVLWFTGPPMDTPRPAKPKYSMEYLHFLATKRKQKDAAAQNADTNSRSAKRARVPTVTETLRDLFKDAHV